jgi:DNA replication protein DnaC
MCRVKARFLSANIFHCRVKYCNTARLSAKLKIAKSDRIYLKEIAKTERQQLILLDDLGLQFMNSQNRLVFLEIIVDRPEIGYVIITSQLSVSPW